MLSVKEFSAKVKAKYPEYKDVDDTTLAHKIVAKYPEYADQVDLGSPTPAVPVQGAKEAPQAPTTPSPIKPDTLTPSTLQDQSGLLTTDIIKKGTDVASNLGVGQALGHLTKNIGSTALGGVKDLVEGLHQVGTGGEALAEGNYGKAAYDVGVGAGKTLSGGTTAGFSPVLGTIGTLPPVAQEAAGYLLAPEFKAADLGTVGIMKLLGTDPDAPENQDIRKAVGGYLAAFTGLKPGGVEAKAEGVKGRLDAIKNPKEALQTKYSADAKADWVKPMESKKSTYSNAKEIYQNAKDQVEIIDGKKVKTGHDISETLNGDKIRLADNIEDGKYTTADTAQKYRDDTAKLSNEGLRPKLEEASLVTPKTPVVEVIQKAIDNIKNNKAFRSALKEKLISKLEKDKPAMESEFKDGFSLLDLHDQKILHANDAGYNKLGDIKTAVEAQKNGILGDTFRSMVEEKAPDNLPVKEFNKELQKRYQAADYLDALNNKKVIQSAGAKLRANAAKVGGAAAGGLFGGGLIGQFAGYKFGGMVENAIENMSSPLKNMVLDSMKKSNPEAIQKVLDYRNQPSEALPNAQASTNVNMNTSIGEGVNGSEPIINPVNSKVLPSSKKTKLLPANR